MDGFVAIDLLERGVEALEKAMVLGSMLFGRGISLLLKQLFFAFEVHLREVDQAFELERDVTTAGSAEEHGAQLVERVHQDSVLIIHGLYANDTLVTPRQ